MIALAIPVVAASPSAALPGAAFFVIASASPGGAGANACSNGSFTENLNVTVDVGNNGYAFPYVTAFARQVDGSGFASGFASLNQSGSGPAVLNFNVSLGFGADDPSGQYVGYVSGEGAGLPPTIAPDYEFSFTVSSPSPSPKSQTSGCPWSPPSFGEQVKTAVMGAVTMCSPCLDVLKAAAGLGPSGLSVLYGLYKDASAGATYLSMVLAKAANDDPPDPDYTQLAIYDPPTPPAVPSGLDSAQTAAATSLFQDVSQAGGYEQAFLTSYERAWGAIDADSQSWYQQQMTAAAGFASQAASTVGAVPGLLETLQDSLYSGLTNQTVTQAELDSFSQAINSGDDSDLLSAIEAWGVSASDATWALQGQAIADASGDVGDDLATVLTADDGTLTTAAGLFANFASMVPTGLAGSPPVVTGVSPSSGTVLGGTPITVTGTNLSGVTGATFGTDNVQTNVSCTDTSCTFDSPSGLSRILATQAVDVVLVDGDGPSATTPADQFTYDVPPPATITRVSPSAGVTGGGSTVTVTGTNLSSAYEMSFGGTLAADLSCTATTCSATSPPGQGVVPVTVTTPAGTSTSAPDSPSDDFTYTETPAPPTVTGVSPASGSGDGGTTVTVTGTNLLETTEIDFGSGNPATDLNCTDTSCTALSPPGSGPVDVTADTPGGTSATSAADTFDYTEPPPPTVTGVSPGSGDESGGNEVVISGTSLALASQIDFGSGDPASTFTCTPTSCDVTAPPGSGTVDVTVTTSTGTSPMTSSDKYTFAPVPVPVITSVTPDTGSVVGGDTVIVDGSNLGDVSELDFGSGNPALTLSCTATSCTAVTPSGSQGTVDVSATSSEGTSTTSSADQFTYVLPPAPTVTSVSPSSGSVGGGTSVTITGTNLDGASEIDFGEAGLSYPQGPCTPTTCEVAAPSASEAGTVDVTVVTPGGTSATSTSDEFTYFVPPAPIVTSVSPASGSVGGDTPITVTGSNLGGASDIQVGTQLASEVSCTDTTCTALTPPNDAGPVDVTVTTPGGTSATTPADTFTYVVPPPPTVTAVSPSSGSVGGGTPVTVIGANLAGTSQIGFGATPVTVDPSACTDTQCTVIVPAATTPGVVDVTVTSPGGTSAASPADAYTYLAPAITGIFPASSPSSGGAVVTISGANLSGATAVDFGNGVQQTDLTFNPNGSIQVTAPASNPGVVDLQVVFPGGATTPVVQADHFTYLPLSVDEFALSDGSYIGGHITQGFDGTMAFTVGSSGIWGTVNPSGTVTETPTPSPDDFPTGITLGSDGRLWYAEQIAGDLVAVTSTGTETEYSIGDPNCGIVGLTAGPDGRLWFTCYDDDQIGAMTTSGDVTFYALPSGSAPRNITVGPDERLWFTDMGSDDIGAITTDGVASQYPIPTPDSQPWSITSGPDGRLWFTEYNGGNMGAITTSGAITEYPVGPASIGLIGVTTGGDGNVWFTETNEAALGSISTSGTINVYPIPDSNAQPLYVATAADGTVWFTEDSGNNVGEVVTPTAPSITSQPSATFTTGTTNTFTFQSTGFPQPTYSETGALPLGVTLSSSGVLSGSPSTSSSASYTILVKADNGVGTPATQTFTLNVAGLSVTTASLPPALRLHAYSATLEAAGAGSNPPYTWSLAAGSKLPVHLTLSKSGVISGTPTSDQSSTFTVVVKDTKTKTHAQETASATFTVTVAQPEPTLDAVSPSSGPGAAGTKVTLTGSDLESASAVDFGPNQATQVKVNSTGTSLTAVSPSGSGTVGVTVTTPAGTSNALSFTY